MRIISVFAIFFLILAVSASPAHCQISDDEDRLSSSAEAGATDDGNPVWEEDSPEIGRETVEIGPDGELLITDDASEAVGVPLRGGQREGDDG